MTLLSDVLVAAAALIPRLWPDIGNIPMNPITTNMRSGEESWLCMTVSHLYPLPKRYRFIALRHLSDCAPLFEEVFPLVRRI